MHQLVLLLLESGAHPSILDDQGHKPLHYASYLERPELVSLLLNHGAEPITHEISGIMLEDKLHCAVNTGYTNSSILPRNR